eukprot:scaffold232455_cov35-Tisochrysis_lutea.AAC.1
MRMHTVCSTSDRCTRRRIAHILHSGMYSHHRSRRGSLLVQAYATETQRRRARTRTLWGNIASGSISISELRTTMYDQTVPRGWQRTHACGHRGIAQR